MQHFTPPRLLLLLLRFADVDDAASFFALPPASCRRPGRWVTARGVHPICQRWLNVPSMVKKTLQPNCHPVSNES